MQEIAVALAEQPSSFFIPPHLAKPPWLRVRLSSGEHVARIRNALRSRGLSTVCEEAHCPNISECWDKESTATFMLMGDVCTRTCKFCAVKTGNPMKKLDVTEPDKLAGAIADIGLSYAVLTSVNRDDLPDGGASHVASCIRAVKNKHPATLVEVLIPDFRGNDEHIQQVIDAQPEVIAHNIETVQRLQRKARDPRAGYEQSLHVLEHIKKKAPHVFTKSSIMLGIGETKEEVIETMKDLRAIGVDILTIGQYLRPSEKHLEIVEYVYPTVFEELKSIGEGMGFAFVASGPLVRSSYRAGELFVRYVLKKRADNHVEQ